MNTIEKASIQETPNLELAKPLLVPELTTHFVDGETPLQTITVDGRVNDDPDVTLVFMPWSDYVARPFSIDHKAVAADATKRLVVAVDNPGVSPRLPKMTTKDRHALSQGDFSTVNELQWQVIETELRRKGIEVTEANIRLAYYSLGARVAANMAAHAPEGVKIERIDLWESAGIAEQNLARFAINYLTRGQDRWKEYQAQNPEWVSPPASIADLGREALTRTAGLAIYPVAIHRAPKVDQTLEMAWERGVIDDRTDVVITNGSESAISQTADNAALADRIRSLGFPTSHYVVEGGTHAIGDSMPQVDHVLKIVE